MLLRNAEEGVFWLAMDDVCENAHTFRERRCELRHALYALVCTAASPGGRSSRFASMAGDKAHSHAISAYSRRLPCAVMAAYERTLKRMTVSEGLAVRLACVTTA